MLLLIKHGFLILYIYFILSPFSTIFITSSIHTWPFFPYFTFSSTLSTKPLYLLHISVTRSLHLQGLLEQSENAVHYFRPCSLPCGLCLRSIDYRVNQPNNNIRPHPPTNLPRHLQGWRCQLPSCLHWCCSPKLLPSLADQRVRRQVRPR
jgi:hypothetical protein